MAWGVAFNVTWNMARGGLGTAWGGARGLGRGLRAWPIGMVRYVVEVIFTSTLLFLGKLRMGPISYSVVPVRLFLSYVM